MKAGTSKDPKFFPVHEIHRILSEDQLDTLLAFHALLDVTMCDPTTDHTDLAGLGKGTFTEDIVTSSETFICKIYGVPDVDSCNKAQVKLFCKGRPQDTLPPTTDAVRFHIMRAHYQATIWNKAHLPHPNLPPVEEMGWMIKEGQLVPRLLSMPPMPKACREFTSCGCTKECLSQHCSCRYVCIIDCTNRIW